MKLPRLRMPSLRGWIVIGLVSLLAMIVYYETVCHLTPFTGDAYLQAYVIQIAPRVAGWVTKVNVSNNSPVKRGDKLFEIDPRPYRFAVERLKAQLVVTRQQVEQLERKKERFNDLIKQRKAELGFAQEEYDKIESLAKEGATAPIERDRVLSTLNAKKAMLAQAEETVAEVEASLAARIEGEHASTKEVMAELENAEYELAHTTVRSPANGYIANLQLSEGAYARVGDPVLAVIDTDSWWVVAAFKENAISRIRAGQTALMCFRMYPGLIMQAKVVSVDWGIKVGQGQPSGVLPDVITPTTWVQPLQRFPVRLEVQSAPETFSRRVGASATVTVFTENSSFFNGLSRMWLLIGSYLDYFY